MKRLLEQRIRPFVTSQALPFTVQASEEIFESIPYAEAIKLPVTPFAVGQQWGQPWHTKWFKLVTHIPVSHTSSDLVAQIDLGFSGRYDGFQVEGLVWRNDCIVQAIQPDRRLVNLGVLDVGERIELWVEAAATPIILGRSGGYGATPMGDPATAGESPLYFLRQAHVAKYDRAINDFAVALHAAMDLATDLDESSAQRARLFAAFEQVGAALDVHDVAGTVAAAHQELAKVLAYKAAPTAHRIVAAGHAHLDTAWLWPIRETRRKAVRTFANAVDLLKKNPDVIFSHSQAQHYAWVSQDAPEVFAQVCELVASGQWEPVGGMWVETDLNLPSGESLLRQFVHGQRAFQEWFGKKCNGAFLPDDFGYPGSLPQIVRHGGAEWFFTQKLSWNETNKFPHHTFWWEGIDGSKIFAHFSPVDTYNAVLIPAELRFAERNFLDHAGSSISLVLYGHGDGGGGPTQAMIDRGRLAADLEGVPQVSFGTVRKFFADAQAEYGDTAPTWVGEMYFEKHRGTYSSQVRTKQANRISERLLHELEVWSSATARRCPEIDVLWKRVLTQQFHDIIPGSSIAWVHDDAERENAEVATQVEALIQDVLHPAIDGSMWLLNSAPVPVAGVFNVQGTARWVETAAMSAVRIDISQSAALPVGVQPVGVVLDSAGLITIDNGLMSLSWDRHGSLESLIHIGIGRSLLAPKKSARFVLRKDTPAAFDAWDIDFDDANSPAIALKAIGLPRLESHSDLSATVICDFATSTSTFCVRWSLNAGSRRTDVSLDAHWQESEMRLQMVLPTAVFAREATCGTQFGHIRRPRHQNTTWDLAKFEVCAHRYVHIGEPGCGVAIMADGARGYDIRGDGLALTLLRSAVFPDPHADIGRQHLEWSLYVDESAGDMADIEIEAARMAHPIRLLEGTPAVLAVGVTLDMPGTLISVVKCADDGSSDLIVRLWETRGAVSAGVLHCPHNVHQVTACDALENTLVETSDDLIVLDKARVNLCLRPFEILTLRIGIR